LSIHRAGEFVALHFDLKSMLDDHEAKSGVRISYTTLARECDVSPDTIKSLATRPDYVPSLELLDKIATALNLDPRRYLRWEPFKTEWT
jgi:DNA-binding XRE family transcriptional regulator